MPRQQERCTLAAWSCVVIGNCAGTLACLQIVVKYNISGDPSKSDRTERRPRQRHRLVVVPFQKSFTQERLQTQSYTHSEPPPRTQERTSIGGHTLVYRHVSECGGTFSKTVLRKTIVQGHLRIISDRTSDRTAFLPRTVPQAQSNEFVIVCSFM